MDGIVQVKLVKECIAIRDLAQACKSARHFSLQEEFPSIERDYQEHVVTRLIGRQQWQAALAACDNDEVMQVSIPTGVRPGDLSMARQQSLKSPLSEGVCPSASAQHACCACRRVWCKQWPKGETLAWLQTMLPCCSCLLLHSRSIQPCCLRRRAAVLRCFCSCQYHEEVRTTCTPARWTACSRSKCCFICMLASDTETSVFLGSQGGCLEAGYRGRVLMQTSTLWRGKKRSCLPWQSCQAAACWAWMPNGSRAFKQAPGWE